MRGPRPARTRARSATIAAFTVLAATVPAGALAASAQEVDTALPYVCDLPSGPRPATVRVLATLPDRVAAGEPVQPADVTTTVELPPEAVADLTALGAADTLAATRLTVGVAQHDATAEATWRGTAAPAPVPESGPLTLTATGDVPSMTARRDGDLTLTAGKLAVDLALTTADGTATEPAALTVDCALAEDAPDGGRLAVVPVGAEPSPGTEAPSDSPSASPSASQAPEEPERQGDRAPTIDESAPGGSPADAQAPPCRYDDQRPATPDSLNAYITGYSNVRKLDGASVIPLTCSLLERTRSDFEMLPDGSGALIINEAVGELSTEGERRIGAFEATFLTFGFTPTTATMVLEQTGPMTVDSLGFMDFSTFFTYLDTYVRLPVVLRVTSLEVNGTPLDVGPDCRTETSLSSTDPEPDKFPGDHMVLYGRGEMPPGEPVVGYQLTSGGPLTGEFTIPAFTGCGTGGEDLDPLLTASVSGPGNYTKQIQGQTCAPLVFNPAECTEDLQPLQVPAPQR
ncbi:DUF6801 domain-containing protein [Streptomyces sp. B93]|uniref:DUF6801 domain-containing protein n=1 Tax=Streptomyces sp. B93 TaxID=2824875 RepID=UPI001B3656DF|nr:DUF6801 domain-containing protein [Streptomyces sp. B93]MBQ1089696.1 hypothetical protein [Streptomyces sp. B93]